MALTCSAFNAKNRLGRLLDRAQAGEVIIITRHGHPVAKLGPAAASDSESVAAALAACKQIRDAIAGRKIKITRKEISSWVREGRK